MPSILFYIPGGNSVLDHRSGDYVAGALLEFESVGPTPTQRLSKHLEALDRISAAGNCYYTGAACTLKIILREILTRKSRTDMSIDRAMQRTQRWIDGNIGARGM